MRFGAYDLLDRIGRGGMGETWKAKKAGVPDAPVVVIKRILAQYAQDAGFVESFVNEAHVTASLDHPNIAHVLDFGQAQGEYFFVIEYVHGRTVDGLQRSAAAGGLPMLPVPVACFLAAEVLNGLQYAHARAGPDGKQLQIVHRDISPDNLLVGFDGEVKLVDFGIAKARIKGRSETEAGLVKGKMQYFSPEQARGEALDGRSDLFSVGVTLYRMVCGRLPFGGAGHEAMRRVVKGDYVPPRAINPQVSDSLATAIDRALEVSRERRFQTAANMETAVRTVLENEAPGFDRAALRGFLHWAFGPELHAEGLEPEIAPTDQQRIDDWLEDARSTGVQALQSEPNPAPPTPVGTVAATRAPLAAPARPLGRLLGGLALFGIGAGVALALTVSTRNDARAAADREAAAAFETAKLKAELERLRDAPAPAPTPVPAPPPAPLTRNWDTVDFEPRTTHAVTLTLARHNLAALFDAEPSKSVVTPRKDQGLSFVEPVPLGIIAVLLPPRGPWSVRMPEDVDTPARAVRGAAVRVFEFFPFGTDKGPREVQVLLSHGKAHEVRDVPIQRFGVEDGHFLMLANLTRAPALELSSAPPPGVSVIFKYSKDVKVLTGTMVLPAPAECALALVARPGTTGEVVVQLSVPRATLPDPEMPLMGDTSAWNPLGPEAKRVTISGTDISRAVRTFKDGQVGISNSDWGRAIYSFESCVRSIPLSYDCHLLLAYARAKSFDRDEALKHYKVFLKLAPKHVSAPSVARIVRDAEKK